MHAADRGGSHRVVVPCAARQVPTDPELSFEQPLVQEAMQAVLDFEGYSMLGVVPEEE